MIDKNSDGVVDSLVLVGVGGDDFLGAAGENVAGSFRAVERVKNYLRKPRGGGNVAAENVDLSFVAPSFADT